MKQLIDILETKHTLTTEDWYQLLTEFDEEAAEYAATKARNITQKRFGKNIYIRGLIEFTNICKNDCYYCGLRASNSKCHRYRLTPDDIFACCENGYELGFRTFVLQGGEDPGFSDETLCKLVRTIKKEYPDCAVTLSVGERPRAVYEAFKKAGADRYLLRHETADDDHYRLLHPESLSPTVRKQCLYDLKDLGFQVGTGFLVGSPYQKPEHLVADLMFIQDFKPQMIGIGPFIPHADTPFSKEPAGSLSLTLFLISLLRLMHPDALIPATTAIGSLKEGGREEAILCGANVVMPNLSPATHRKDYSLYNNKLSDGSEAAESRNALDARLKTIGYQTVTDRGDYQKR